MKTIELIKYIESNIVCPVFTSERQRTDFDNRVKCLVSVLRHKNDRLYRENKLNLNSMIEQQIDLCQRKRDTNALEHWQEAQRKLMQLAEQELV